MLHKLDIVYKCIFHGEESKIIHTEPGEQVKIYPKRDGIKFANHKVFKYKFKEWGGLCPAIVKFGDKKVIMPWGVECHPKTTIDDIEVIKKEKKEKINQDNQLILGHLQVQMVMELIKLLNMVISLNVTVWGFGDQRVTVNM